MQLNKEYQTTNTMAFKQIIDSKKLLALLAVFMLAGTNVLMAQATAAAEAEKPGVNWLSVGYYVLIFFILCISVAIIGKVLKVYDLSQQIQGKKGIQWNNIMAIICLVVFQRLTNLLEQYEFNTCLYAVLLVYMLHVLNQGNWWNTVSCASRCGSQMYAKNRYL